MLFDYINYLHNCVHISCTLCVSSCCNHSIVDKVLNHQKDSKVGR